MAIDAATRDRIRVGTLDELKAQGRKVVKGRHCPLLVVYDQGQVHVPVGESQCAFKIGRNSNDLIAPLL